MGVTLERLSKLDGPNYLASLIQGQPKRLCGIRKLEIVASTRKADFISARLNHSFELEKSEVTRGTSSWDEDRYKGIYIVDGLSPALKVGVADGGGVTAEKSEEKPSVRVATDVSLLTDDKTIHRHHSGISKERLEEELISLFTSQRDFVTKTSIAGLRKDRNIGLTANIQTGFCVSEITPAEIHEYVGTLSDEQRSRSPGGLLWPHEILQKHIVEIGGISHDDPRFEEKKIELFSTLLGIPREMNTLLSALDSDVVLGIASTGGSLFEYFEKNGMLPLNENQKLMGKWAEVVMRGDELYILCNASPNQYVGMSELAKDNFLNADNYRYLREVGNEEELDKYIKANSPVETADLCERENNLCNLVLMDANGVVVGYRVVRKENEKADGRRIHTSRHHAGEGLGSLMLTRSEQEAKQAGCTHMEVHATGESAPFFQKQGFVGLGKTENTRGVFKDKPSGYYLMRKEL